MQALDRFWPALWEVLDEWEDGERDWADVDAELATVATAGIDPAKAKALLATIWVCDRLVEDPSRTQRIADALREAQWSLGVARTADRRRARSNAAKQFERIKSRVIYGFFLDRGRDSASEADIRTLIGALECVLGLECDTRSERVLEAFGQFRSRINRLKRTGVSPDEAATLFDQVYDAVIQYI